MFTVLIRGLEFYGYHGVSDEERKVGHRYRVDLELEVDGRADETDDVGDTVDYGLVAQELTATARSREYRTFECLARSLANDLIDRHPPILEATITLVKVNPPIPTAMAEAGVRLRVRRA